MSDAEQKTEHATEITMSGEVLAKLFMASNERGRENVLSVLREQVKVSPDFAAQVMAQSESLLNSTDPVLRYGANKIVGVVAEMRPSSFAHDLIDRMVHVAVFDSDSRVSAVGINNLGIVSQQYPDQAKSVLEKVRQHIDRQDGGVPERVLLSIYKVLERNHSLIDRDLADHVARTYIKKDVGSVVNVDNVLQNLTERMLDLKAPHVDRFLAVATEALKSSVAEERHRGLALTRLIREKGYVLTAAAVDKIVGLGIKDPDPMVRGSADSLVHTLIHFRSPLLDDEMIVRIAMTAQPGVLGYGAQDDAGRLNAVRYLGAMIKGNPEHAPLLVSVLKEVGANDQNREVRKRARSFARTYGRPPLFEEAMRQSFLPVAEWARGLAEKIDAKVEPTNPVRRVARAVKNLTKG